ncbi:ABC transporter substrate-binding protein [Methylopila sp. M107]|uniref:ABC transporter substrate-binding protein n=1 Tax=Methylopila sp. M107 TaxID=1101190 RepID=UPI00035E11E6|nr:ABC transporter substrate-binding protein [Methylopila sp. M107]
MMMLRTLLAAVILAALAGPCSAQTTLFGDKGAADKLTIWASTDPESVDALIEAYLLERPNLAIIYRNMQSSEIYEEIKKEGASAPDIVISSAADLQVKLVNDGYALTHRPPDGVDLPEWANWRNQAFGITAEPAVIVYNRQLATLGPLPRTRLDLAAMISEHVDRLSGKVATYDIEKSGIGYLFATKDSLYSSTFTMLTQAFGRARAKTYCCSRDMLDLLAKGDMLVGYNILGSYALAHRRRGSPIEIILPQDYTLILSRVAILPVAAKRPDLGASFLDFLLSPRARALDPKLAEYAEASPQGQSNFTLHPIPLGPSLLVFLDRLKHDRFIRTWRNLMSAEN